VEPAKKPTTLSVSSPITFVTPCGTIAGITARSPACMRLALAGDDVEDLLLAVRVGGEPVAGSDLEVDDALSAAPACLLIGNWTFTRCPSASLVVVMRSSCVVLTVSMGCNLSSYNGVC
jgi:hypothetical protein